MAALLTVYVAITMWVFLVGVGRCRRAVVHAFAHGFAPHREFLRALTGQTPAGPTVVSSALAAWFALMHGMLLSAVAAIGWPVAISPLLAAAYFFPWAFKMALGALALLVIWFKVVRPVWKVYF